MSQTLEADPRVAMFGAPGDPAHGAPPGATFCEECGLVVAIDMAERHEKWHAQFGVLRGILEAKRYPGPTALTCKECGGRMHPAHATAYNGHVPKRMPIGYWCPKCGRLVTSKEARTA